ncbi:hypothetical protein BH23BAC1_BH23BAC1_44250 [soil metagenome]
MKKLSLLFILSSILYFTACVDDFEDANPPRRLDAPDVKIASSADTIRLGETVTFTVNVTDAPGVIDSVGYSLSTDVGTFVLDQASVDAVRGQTSGSFTASYTAPANQSGLLDVSFTVYDRQPDPLTGERNRKSTTSTKRVRFLHIHPAPTYTLSPGPAASIVLKGGQSQTYQVKVTSFPGGIGGINANIVSGGGTIEVNQDQLALVMTGTSPDSLVAITYTAPNVVGPARLSISVFDATEAQRTSATANRTIFIDYCIISPEDIAAIVGNYRAVATGNVGSVDTTYNIIDTVAITHALPADTSVFTISDVTFGLYSHRYDRSTLPSGPFDLCDGNLSGRNIEDQFGIPVILTGMREEDGTIFIEWENDSGDTGEVTLTKIL